MSSEREMMDRISSHYRNILLKKYYTNEIEEKRDRDHYNETLGDVIEKLLPYARQENYWWEQKGPEMAYYQLKTNLFVVDEEDFKRSYKVLMGKKFNSQKLRENPEEVIEEATRKYNKLVEKKNKSRR